MAAEVLVEFPDVLTTNEGRSYLARACGSENGHGTWQGWIEFIPTDGSAPVRSGRETTQPNRQDTLYWATGLTGVYLEGALDRALNPLTRATPPPPPQPAFDGPAPPVVQTRSILNPFSVYQKGEELLRRQLHAFSPWHLVNIITAHGLSEEDPSGLATRPAAELVEMIVAAVRAGSREPVR